MGRAPLVLAAILVSATPSVVSADDATEPTPTQRPDIPPVVDAPGVVIDAPPAGPPAPVQPIAQAPPPAPAAPPAPAVAAVAAVAPPPPKRETHGLALAAGLGFTYGYLGLQARYDVPITRSLTVSPFVSAGVVFGWLSGPVGVSAALGARHRLVADLGVAPLDWLRFSLHGTTVAERLIFGPLLAAGYERMSERGWFWRGTLELAYETWTTAPVPIHSYFRLFTGVAVGRRIW